MFRGGSHSTVGAKRAGLQGVPAVGLVNGTSGVPLALLFLQDASGVSHTELRSLEQASALRARSSQGTDVLAWNAVEAFFLAGGKSLYCLVQPLSAGAGYLGQMLGEDGGVGRRTGIYRLRDWVDRADTVLIPQAASLLNAEEHAFICQRVFDLLGEDQGMLYLVDLPCGLSADQAAAWAQDRFSPDSAAFHPWIAIGNQVVPPSSAIAAWVQLSDAQVGVGELSVQQPLPPVFRPVVSQQSTDRNRLLEARINTFLPVVEGLQIWGAYTLADGADTKSRLIPLRRGCVKIRQAVEQLCEPFVLEAADRGLPVCVENRLQNFLRSVRGVFCKELGSGFETQVSLVDVNGEERIQVYLRYKLPHSVERMSLSFVA